MYLWCISIYAYVIPLKYPPGNDHISLSDLALLWVDVFPFPVKGGICWSRSSGLFRGCMDFHGCKGSWSCFSLEACFLQVHWTGIKGLERLYLNHLETLKHGCSFHCELSTGKLSRRFLRVLNKRMFFGNMSSFLRGCENWLDDDSFPF